MESVRSLLMTPGHVESHETKFERIGRVLSRGFMIGAAILQPVFAQYEHTFYKLLVFCIYTIAVFAHIILNWEAVKRYFFLALVIIFTPVLVTLPYSKASIYLLLDRLAVLIMLICLCIEECSRHLTPDSRFIPPDGGSEVDEHSIHMLGIVDEYFAHMDGGQGEQYHTPSQVSSDISLSNAGPGRLPPSCDTMTRTFWPDNIDQNRECRKDDGDENQES